MPFSAFAFTENFSKDSLHNFINDHAHLNPRESCQARQPANMDLWAKSYSLNATKCQGNVFKLLAFKKEIKTFCIFGHLLVINNCDEHNYPKTGKSVWFNVRQ